MIPMRKPFFTCAVLFLFATAGFSQNNSSFRQQTISCDDPTGIFCTEVYHSIGYNGAYTGHDEPSTLFYSSVSGSGNTMVYLMQLPKDPPKLPNQSGTGGTFNFQLHPAFWVGMAMCDDQSAPNPGGSYIGANIPCTPDSDSNIFDGTAPTASDYIGLHPGTAFMEMQFYPPGWFVSCDTTDRWCSALNIDSLSENMNTGLGNNSACGGAVEYVNFAFITKSGVPGGPPSPLLQNGSTFTPTADTLFYHPGDVLRIVLQDTAHGLKITIKDLTSGESGSMTASAANGFGEILYDPSGTSCDPATHNIPTDFHPMYATSSEHTRVPWAAHSYNIAFSDEIGHFEFCNAVDQEGGSCTQDGVHDLDNALGGLEDDFGCFDAAFAAEFGLVPIGGCLSSDFDFDGVPYQTVWPGTITNPGSDHQLHARPVLFTSPLFTSSSSKKRQNFDRVAFEADLPRIESLTNPPCQRHVSNPADPHPGEGCVNPPAGANFYPIFSTTGGTKACTWQLGGASIPDTDNTFGGSSTTEFGPLLQLAYPAANGQVTVRYNNFRQVLANNPCPSSGGIAAQ